MEQGEPGVGRATDEHACDPVSATRPSVEHLKESFFLVCHLQSAKAILAIKAGTVNSRYNFKL
jgi:hypothetical protein